jgi:hypothetical protein
MTVSSNAVLDELHSKLGMVSVSSTHVDHDSAHNVDRKVLRKRILEIPKHRWKHEC